MANAISNQLLNKFYNDLQQDIRSDQLSDEEGGTQEQLFTMLAASLLAESGEAENVRPSYDEKVSKSGIQHKVNAYAISDNYETLDLIITIYNGTEEIFSVSKTDIDKAAKRVASFFRNATHRSFVESIEESSEVFQLAMTLVESEEIKETLSRVNAIILTDGVYQGGVPDLQIIAEKKVYFKVVDLNYLYNISEKSHTPIEIDFKADGYKVPCIKSPSVNKEYQTYLAIIPGRALVDIYEQFGSRLLEQNVRSFLQFTGKVNGGIRRTILEEPHMFLAFNNGIAATADEIDLESNSDGLFITKVNDLQIVNGGQTTASIYHTWKKDKKEVSEVFVQVKLSVIKNKDRFDTIVGQISEYANTQNKVSVSDLSSNRPYHIELEKISRNLWAPPSAEHSIQTRWFYERARGQYKNARLKEGSTPSKQKAFDMKNPKSQVFTKEELAKYISSFEEITEGKKIVMGPHFVVRGNQKNYVQFMQHNIPNAIDDIYYENLIAKAVLFRAAEKRYGVKPNAIGDMRYITVPYSIAYLTENLPEKIDLYKIWKAQSISSGLEEVLYALMVKVENFIKRKAPGSLYSEWAKKEECWLAVKEQDFNINIKKILADFETDKSLRSRKRTSGKIVDKQKKSDEDRIRALSPKAWKEIEKWGTASKLLTIQEQNITWTLALKLRIGKKLSSQERLMGVQILDLALQNIPDVIYE